MQNQFKCHIIVGSSKQEFWITDDLEPGDDRWEEVIKVIRGQLTLAYGREVIANAIAENDICDYESVTRCKNPKMPDSRLCTYHGTISAVRFDPRYK